MYNLAVDHMGVAGHSLIENIHHSYPEYSLVHVDCSQKLVADCNYNQCCLLDLQGHQGLVVAAKNVADYSSHNPDLSAESQLTGPSSRDIHMMLLGEDSLHKVAETYYTVLIGQGMLQVACTHNQVAALEEDPSL